MSQALSTKDRRRVEALISKILALTPERSLQDSLAELEVPLPYRIRMKVLFFPHTLESSIREKAFPDSRLTRLNNTSHAFRLDTRTPNGAVVRTHFVILPTSEPHVAVALSVSTVEEWVPLARFLRDRYPRIVPIFLSQRELLSSVLELRKMSEGYELRVRELTAKEPFSSDGVRKSRSVRAWTDEELQGALTGAADRKQIIQSARIGFYQRVGDEVAIVPSLVCKISKKSEVDITGRLHLAWNTVVQHIARLGESKLQFYSHRGLREAHYRAAPLKIVFQRPVFSDVAEVRKLVAALEKYPKSMHAVRHGNPYAHVQLSDGFDGSSFDVWAVTPNEIAVIPRLKATAAAIERLIHYVFEEFREGLVQDYGAGRPN
jgi:hypothetical protein